MKNFSSDNDLRQDLPLSARPFAGLGRVHSQERLQACTQAACSPAQPDRSDYSPFSGFYESTLPHPTAYLHSPRLGHSEDPKNCSPRAR